MATAARRPLASLLLAACAAASLAASVAAQAADLGSAAANYQRERANCLSGKSHQDRETCLKEARNAYADAKRGRLDNGESSRQLQANAVARCSAQPVSERAMCERIARGEGTVVGSVEGGGVVRELVVREPVQTARTQ